MDIFMHKSGTYVVGIVFPAADDFADFHNRIIMVKLEVVDTGVSLFHAQRKKEKASGRTQKNKYSKKTLNNIFFVFRMLTISVY